MGYGISQHFGESEGLRELNGGMVREADLIPIASFNPRDERIQCFSNERRS